MSELKTCSRCKKEKPIDDFYRSSEFPDGRQYNCKACGRAHSRRWFKERAELSLLAGARDRARKLGLPFDLEVEDIVIPDKCPVFGVPFERSTRFGPSLDRIKPELGYVRGNVAVISRKANSIKNDGTADEILAVGQWLKGIEDAAH